jgi:hypothetical protein
MYFSQKMKWRGLLILLGLFLATLACESGGSDILFGGEEDSGRDVARDIEVTLGAEDNERLDYEACMEAIPGVENPRATCVAESGYDPDEGDDPIISGGAILSPSEASNNGLHTFQWSGEIAPACFLGFGVNGAQDAQSLEITFYEGGVKISGARGQNTMTGDFEKIGENTYRNTRYREDNKVFSQANEETDCSNLVDIITFSGNSITHTLHCNGSVLCFTHVFTQ